MYFALRKSSGKVCYFLFVKIYTNHDNSFRSKGHGIFLNEFKLLSSGTLIYMHLRKFFLRKVDGAVCR